MEKCINIITWVLLYMLAAMLTTTLIILWMVTV
jgi:hypothetical protein